MTNLSNVDLTKFILPIPSVKDIIRAQANLFYNLRKSINGENIPIATAGTISYNFQNESSRGFYFNFLSNDSKNNFEKV